MSPDEYDPVRILIVDDQPSQLAGLEILLADLGNELVRASSGAEALELVSRLDFGLILMDVAMPGMDGIETTARLRAMPQGRHVPIIFLTGNAAMQARLLHGYTVGAVDYLVKPVDPTVLRAKVSVFVDLFRTTRELERQADRLREQDELLRASEESHRVFAELASDLRAVVRLPPNAPPQVELFGETFLKQTGLSSAKLADWRNHVHAEDVATAEAHVESLLSGEEVRGELAIVLPDGRSRTMRIVARPIQDAPGGRVVRVYAAALDVTELLLLEEKLRNTQKTEVLGSLAGGIAHDFNNLLSVINGNADLALDTCADGPLRDALLEIQDAGSRAARLTGQLLAFGRAHAAPAGALDANAVIADMRSLLSRLLGANIEVLTELDARPCLVKVGRAQLEQIVMNLALNARDAMPSGGRLTLTTRVVDRKPVTPDRAVRLVTRPTVELVVADTGSGMEPRIAERIFEPFFTTKRHGHGMGLATVHGIVEQRGGTITVESRQGHGTTFRITLPAADPAPQSAATPTPEGTAEAQTGTVLLVEDEGGIRRLARNALKRCGYTVLEAEDGEDALRVAADHTGPIDVLVTDVRMPRMNGPKLVEALRASRPGMQVLYLSGCTQEDLQREQLDPEKTECVFKPFRAVDLTAKVRELADRKRPPGR